MAIAVPFLLTAAGATATTAAIVSVAFAVTGISEKINKAASNVFGEDLVKVANIAGMAYGAFNGGFEIDGFGTEAVLAERAANVAASAGELAAAADVAGGLDPNMAPLEAAATSGSEAVTAGYEGGAFPDLGQAADGATNVVDRLAGAAPTESAADMAQKYQEATTATATTGSTTPVATAPVTSTATATPPAATSNPAFTQPSSALADGVSSQGMTSQSMLARQAGGQTGPVSESFIDKLVRMSTDAKTGEIKNSVITLGGDLVKGAAAGYSAAKQREQYDQELKRRDSLANMGGAGWRQTR